jgi:hypothetical protein
MDVTALILKLLDLVVAGSLVVERAQELKSKIEDMKAEGRDPTPEEWDALFATIDTDAARLDDADKRLNP